MCSRNLQKYLIDVTQRLLWLSMSYAITTSPIFFSMKFVYTSLFLLFWILGTQFVQGAGMPQAGPGQTSGILKNLGQLRNFEGEAARDVKYYYRNGPFSVFFLEDRISYALHYRERLDSTDFDMQALMDDPDAALADLEARQGELRVKAHRVDLVFQNPSLPSLNASQATGAPVHFYKSEVVARDLRYHQTLRYEDIYPGIDLVFRVQEDGGLKYDFEVAPSASASDIELAIEGCDSLRAEGNRLRMFTSLGEIEEHLPAVYARRGAESRTLTGSFQLQANRLRYQVEAPARSGEQLIIDPVVQWSTYFGGDDDDGVPQTALDPRGGMFIMGTTLSSNFPTTSGAFDTTYSGSTFRDPDIFLSRFSDDDTLEWSTFIGGSDDETQPNLVVDDSSNVYFTGITNSSDLPASAGAFKDTLGGTYDVFLGRFDSSGSRRFITYVGGGVFPRTNGFRFPFNNFQFYGNAPGIDLDNSGNIYVAGEGDNFSSSFFSNDDWPTSTGAYQTSSPSRDYYGIARFSDTGRFDLGSYYYPANSTSFSIFGGIHELEVGPNRVAIVGIFRGSGLPGANGFATSNSQFRYSGFLTEFGLDLDTVLHATYVGGSSSDLVTGLAYAPGGDVWLAGQTLSGDFPTTANAIQSILGQSTATTFSSDGFVTVLDSARDTVYSSFFGKGGNDYFGSVEYDARTDQVVMTGYTGDATTTPNAANTNKSGNFDGILVRMTRDFRFALSTYIGGSGDDGGWDLNLLGDRLAITGITNSTDFPVTLGAYQTSIGGGTTNPDYDATIQYLDNCDTLQPSFADTTRIDLCQGDTLRFTPRGTYSKFGWYVDGNSRGSNDTLTLTSGGDVWLVVADNNGCVGISERVQVIDRPDPNPTISANGPTTFCLGDSVTLSLRGSFPKIQWSTNLPADTNRSLTVSSNGIYLAQVTNRFGCSSFSQPISVSVNTPLQPLISVSKNTICQGDSATLSVTNAVFSSYNWSNNATGSSIKVGSSGNYFVRTVDNNGCSATSNTVNITVDPVPSANISVSGDTVFCQGGSVTLNGSGGVFRIWSNSSFSNSITVSTSGQYYFTSYLPGSSCTANSDTITVVVRDDPNPDLITSRSPTLCPGDSVTITAPAGFSSYTWNTSDTGRSIRVADTGNYFVTVVDTNFSNCTGNSDTVAVRFASTPVATLAASDTTLCPGDTAILSGAPFSSYQWSNGDTTQTIAVASAGSFSYIGTDSIGCTASSDTFTTNTAQAPNPTIGSNGPTVLCEGDNIQLRSNQTFAQYRWSTGATTRVITVDSSGTYALSATNASGCSATSPGLQVTVNDTVDGALQPIAALAVCADDSAGIVAPDGNFAYQWNNNAPDDDTAYFTQTGPARVTVTDQATGCQSRLGPLSITVNNNPQPRVIARGPTQFCPGDSVVLEIPNSYPSYQWNSGQSTRIITVKDSGDYSATVSNQAGCSGTSQTETVSIFSRPSATLSNDDPDNAICAGDSITFTAGGGASYLFRLNGQPLSSLSGSQYITDSLQSGDLVDAIVTDANGCQDTSAVNAPTVNTSPNATLTANDADLAVCHSDTLIFRTTAQGRFFNFRLNGSIAQFNTADTFTTDFTDGDSLDLVVLDANGCSDTSAKVGIEVFPQPSATIASDAANNEICAGDTVQFSATGGSQYQFLLNGNPQAVTNMAAYTTDSLADADAVAAIAIDANGCRDTSSAITTTVNPLPTPTLSSSDPDDEICIGDGVTFTAGGGTQYRFLLDGMVAQDGSQNGYFTDSLNNGQTLRTLVTDNEGCRDTSSAITTTVNPLPTPTLSSSDPDDEICAGDTVTFTAGGGVQYQFLVNGQALSASSSNTYTTDSLLNNQSVRVVVTDANGCTDTSQAIQTAVNPLPTVFLFSSDSDNEICLNEQVTFSTSSFSQIEFLVNGNTAQAGTSTRYATDSLGDQDAVRVLVEDQNGCRDTSAAITTTVNGLPTAQLAFSEADTALCQGDTVAFTGSGANQYRFFRNGSVVQANAGSRFETTTLSQGDQVRVEVTDANGCRDTSAAIAPTVFTRPTATLTSSESDDALCRNDTITFAASANAVSNYRFLLNGASVQTGPQPQYTTDSLLDGQQVSAILTDTNGCLDTSSAIQTTVYALPTVTLTSSESDDAICRNDSIAFNASGADQYRFFLSGNPAQSGSASRFALDSLDDQEQVFAIGTDANGCIDTTDTIQTTVFDLPTAGLSISDPDSAFCTSDTVAFTATGGIGYVFRVDGNEAQNSTQNRYATDSLSDGAQVSVVVTDANGCRDTSAGLPVTVFPLPTPTLSISEPDNAFCLNDTVRFTADGGNRYRFQVDGQTLQASMDSLYVTDRFQAGQQLRVIVEDTNGCVDTSRTIAPRVDPLPVAQLSTNDADNQICRGDSIILTAAGGAAYRFEAVNGGVLQEGSSSQYATASVPDTTLIRVVVTDTNGCLDTSQAEQIIVNTLPQPQLVSSAGTAFCSGTSVAFSASGGQRYAFARNGTVVQDSIAANWLAGNGLQDGDSVSVLVTDSNACQSDTSLGLRVFALPTVSLSSSANNNTLCPGDTVSFVASGARRYTFRRNGTALQQGTSDTLVRSTLSNGDVISVQGTDTNSCQSASVSLRMTVRQAPQLSVSPSGPVEICPGDTATLTAPANLQGYRWSNGDTTRSIRVSQAGQYRVRTIRTGNQCAAASPLVRVRERKRPDASITLNQNDNRICAGDSVQLSAPAGLTQYRWSNGDSTQSITVSQGGTFRLEVVDSLGCRNANDTSIILDSLPTSGISFFGIAPCVGDSLSLNADGGFVRYRWSTGDSGRQTAITRSRPVTVQVTDTNGCVGVSDTVQPSFRALPRPSIQANGPLNFCLGDSVVLAIDSSYANFVWSTNQTDSAITISTTDTVVLSVTQNGCTGADTAFTIANTGGPVALQISGDTSLCPGDTVFLQTAQAYSRYQWSTGDTTRRIAVTEPGRYDVQAGLTGCSGQSREVQVDTVPVGPRPRLSSSLGTRFCAGDTTLLAIANSSQNFSGLRWSDGSQEDTLEVAAAGNYFLTVAGAQGCRVPSDTVSLNVDPLPAPIISSPDTAFCSGDSLQLRLNDPSLARVRWNTSQTTANIFVDQANAYFAEVTDTLGCSGFSDTLQVGEYAAPVAQVVYQSGPVICAGDSARVTTQSSFASYRWSNGDRAAVTAFAEDGVRPSVRITDGNGCSADAEAAFPLEVLQVDSPTIEVLSSTDFCPGDSVQLRAVGQPGVSGFTWSNGLSGDTVTLFATQTLTVSQTNANGCVGTSAPQAVQLLPEPDAGFSINAPDPICEDDTVRLEANATGATIGYRWSTGAAVRRIALTNSDTVSLRVIDGNDCESQSAAFVFNFNDNPETPVLTGVDSVVCEGDSLTLAPENDYFRYRWNTGDTTRQLRVRQGGDYQLEVINRAGCSSQSAARTIAQRPTPEPELLLNRDTLIFCEGDTLQARTRRDYDGYRWSTGSASPNVRLAEGNTSLFVTARAGVCEGNSDTVEVKVVPQPQATITMLGESSFCDGDSLILAFNGDASAYEWNTGSFDSTISITESGAYRLTAFRTDSLNGIQRSCRTASQTATVDVRPRPEAFTLKVQGDTLMGPDRQESLQYQWFLDGAPIIAETESEIIALADGVYQLEVRNDVGCTRRASDSISVDAPDVDVFPVPSDGRFFYQLNLEQRALVEVHIFNAFGQEVFSRTETMDPGFQRRLIDISGVTDGWYLIEFETPDKRYQERMLILR